MNDITIKQKNIKRELRIFLGIFLFAFLLNIYSILHYKTSWSELYTHLHIVVLIAIFLYCVLAGGRLLLGMVSKLFSKKQSAS